MDASDYFDNLRAQIVGKPIRFKRLVTNSLLIYVDCEPEDEVGYIIWFEPTWHYCGVKGVIAGSRQAQAEDETVFRKVSESLVMITKTTIVSLELDQLTFDLKVELSDQSYIKTFVSDPTDDETWHISDKSSDLTLYGTPQGLELHQISI